MKQMRSTWTDSRLDDLNKRVDRIREEVHGLRGEMGAELREVRGEIGGLNRTIIQVGGGVIGTLVVGLLGLIATQI